MTASLWSFWNNVAQPAAARLKPGEWALLIVLAASLLVLSVFRERYLAIWAAAWTLLVSSRFVQAYGARTHIPVRYLPAVEQAAFVIAIGLFAGAVFAYIRERNLVTPLAAVTVCTAGFAVARVLLWPDSLPLRVALEVSYRIILFTAAVALLRARRGRREATSWMLAGFLLLQHLNWTALSAAIPASAFVAADTLLGVSMLLVVFREARARAQRLTVLRALTESIVQAQQQGGMLDKALESLRQLTKSKAAWFRLIEGGHLVATHAVGVSSEFLREVGIAELSTNVSQMLDRGKPETARRSSTTPEDQSLLKSEKIHYLTTVPVLGKKSPIGLLYLGSAAERKLTAEESEFLETCGRQLGIAIENFRLLEQVLRSQRQWRNTFDSVHDIILAHDAEFRVIKANQVLLEHLEQSSSDVIGSTCESVLPHSLGEWTGCPYCARGDEEVTEGADPCFGGFSLVSSSSYSEQGSQQKGTIHIVRDITERHSAEEKYRLLFDQVQEGVYVATPDGRLLDCNDALVNMLGYERREELL
ncbi:MAG: PAS domain S-box protein, partial [Candidatus Sulfotelmatobacter sp.]